LRYNGQTGASMGVFATSRQGCPIGITDITFGPNGNLFAGHYGCPGFGAVEQFDSTTGSYLGIFASIVPDPTCTCIQGLTFGPDGNLYVATEAAVQEFNGTTGAVLKTFAVPPANSNTDSVAFGPDGNLYVGTASSTTFDNSGGEILKYDPVTGALLDVFIPPFSGGLGYASHLSFRPDGRLYVVDDAFSQVLRFDAATGAFLDVFVPPGSGGLKRPISMAFAPSPQSNTPTGSPTVQLTDATTGTAITLNFSAVTQAGTTSVTSSTTGAPPPSAFKLGTPPTYYDISTSAIFSGSVTICINYSTISYGNVNKLRLFHFANGAWVDTTTTVDTTHSIICGSATSFSSFAIFESEYDGTIQQPINANGTSVFNANRGVVPVKFTLTLNGVRTCQLPPATVAVFRTSGDTVVGVNESDFLQPSDSGSNFRIDTTNCQYIYNHEHIGRRHVRGAAPDQQCRGRNGDVRIEVARY